jgi:hypothetical protein
VEETVHLYSRLDTALQYVDLLGVLVEENMQEWYKQEQVQ